MKDGFIASRGRLAGTSTALTLRVLVVAVSLTAATVGSLGVGGAGATSPKSISLSEANKGHVVTVHPGDHVTVVLHTTYWSFLRPVSSPVISQVGRTVIKGGLPASPGGCAPGSGCGTATAHFVALKTGQYRLHALRSTCGEVMKCSPSQGVWTVVIKVR